MEVAQGVEYIHSEGAVHGDLRGVIHLKHIMHVEMLTFLRTMFSWMPTFMFKLPILD
jgi:hypothetical protein